VYLKRGAAANGARPPPEWNFLAIGRPEAYLILA
jgi:hypothetical protein